DVVDPAGVRPAAPVPRQAALGVDGSTALRRDEVEAPHVRVGEELRRREAARAEAVRVERGPDLGRSLTAGGVLVGDHDLTARPDRDVAVVALAVRGRNALGRAEGTDRAEPGDRSAR